MKTKGPHAGNEAHEGEGVPRWTLSKVAVEKNLLAPLTNLSHFQIMAPPLNVVHQYFSRSS